MEILTSQGRMVNLQSDYSSHHSQHLHRHTIMSLAQITTSASPISIRPSSLPLPSLPFLPLPSHSDDFNLSFPPLPCKHLSPHPTLFCPTSSYNYLHLYPSDYLQSFTFILLHFVIQQRASLLASRFNHGFSRACSSSFYGLQQNSCQH